MNHLIVWLGSTPAPSPVTTNPPDNLAWLSPTISAGAVVLVGLFVLFSNLWQRRQNRKDQVADKSVDAAIAVQPKITDGWEEVRLARQEASDYYKLYRTFEGLYYTVMSALRHLARVFRAKDPDAKFDQDIVDALAIVPPDTTPADATK